MRAIPRVRLFFSFFFLFSYNSIGDKKEGNERERGVVNEDGRGGERKKIRGKYLDKD